MLSFLDSITPTIVLGNFAEGHYEFLARTANPLKRQEIIADEDAHGDRILLWHGEPKLVISSYPIQHADFLLNQLNYHQTLHYSPSHPSGKLSLDVLHQPELLAQIIQYAGPQRTIQMIPYATTAEFLQLAEALRSDHGLTVLLPESPKPDSLWLRDYIDTKVGFRLLVQRCPLSANVSIPSGYICQTPLQASQAANWFVQRGESCIIKIDSGENGIGHKVVSPQPYSGIQTTLTQLQQNCYLSNDLLTVERYIQTQDALSPSLELFVCEKEKGKPQITYVSQQLFKPNGNTGDFEGVLISNQLINSPWYPSLAESGLRIAEYLQSLGYIGHFDLDCILDSDNQIYLLEINARRTGGTHVHEFAQHYFGENYLEQVALLSNDAASSGTIDRVETLLEALQDILFPIHGLPAGIIITITSTLSRRKFGYIAVGKDPQELQALENQLTKRIGG